MTSRRFDAVRQRIVTSRLHGLLVTSLPNIRYLTGFSGSNAVVLVRSDEIILVTDTRYKLQAPTDVRGVRTIITRENAFEAIAEKHLVAKRERIGFEANSLSVSKHARLKGLLRGVNFIPTVSLVEQVRVTKDESEIDAIREAARITDKVFKKILTILKPGMRELEVAAEIGYWNRVYGAESDAFDPIVASGTRGAFPHGRATTRKLERGEMVTIDMGCRVRGYHSDLTRTVSLGKPRRELKTIYRIVHDAQQKALETATALIKVRALDGASRGHIRKCGYGRLFPHALGHGLGLEIHEQPLVSATGKGVLPENSVITIEPGIYVPGVGGVRIEDDLVLRHGGNEILTESPRQLIEL